MKRQTIKYARLHAPFFIKDVGDLPNTLPPVNKTFPKFKMWRDDGGSLMLEVQSPTSPRVEICEIPSANVVGMIWGEVIDMPEELSADKPGPRMVEKKVVEPKKAS